MKKIECLISHKIFPDLERVLRGLGIHGMTISEVKGYGNEQTRPEPYLFLPKIKIEIYCYESDVEGIVSIMIQTCRTGNLGDGKIAIYPVEDMVRIRTGERGEVAV